VCVCVCLRQVGLLGGIQRSSVSLVVIIVEGTGKVDYLLPIIFTTVCAKWVGDKLNDGIYHTMHHVKGIPFLENEPAKGLRQLAAQDLMHADPVCLRTVSRDPVGYSPASDAHRTHASSALAVGVLILWTTQSARICSSFA
jgi:hypothetical protein